MVALGFPSKIILREETCNQDIVEWSIINLFLY